MGRTPRCAAGTAPLQSSSVSSFWKTSSLPPSIQEGAELLEDLVRDFRGDGLDAIRSACQLGITLASLVLMESARSGSISSRQRQFTENILSLANLEVRHIVVPRTDVAYLSADNSREQNLRIIRESGHSRFPLGAPDLDHVKGLVLAGIQTHCAIVMDEHGTAVGMAFLEDAIEEIVGPIYDELDEKEERVEKLSPNTVRMAGSVPLPEAATVLGLDFQEEADTVGGWLVATLGRFPEEGDSVEIADYRATVEGLEEHRIGLVRFEEKKDDGEDPPTA